MKKNLLDILACPLDKNYPLELFEFNTKEIHAKNNEDQQHRPSPQKIDNKFNDKIEQNENTTTTTDITTVIIDGMLYCNKCNRFYPIVEEIPILLPDDLRDKNKDIEFLNKWKNKISKDILGKLKPWSI